MSDQFFFSYARADSELAQRLARDLRSADVAIWIDVLDIVAGETWDRAVENALRQCSGLLVVLSPTSVASRSVMDEVSFALDEDKTIVPVIGQECEVPFRLRRIHHVDFTHDYATALPKLVHALGGRPATTGDGQAAGSDEPAPATEPTRPPAAVDRRPAGDSPAPSRKARLRTALATGLMGAALSGLFLVMIFANDTREDVQGWYAAAGAAIAGLGWAIAGFVAGPRRTPLLLAGALALIFLAAWIGIYGTYQDVMGAAVIVGAPLGAVVGAALGTRMLKRRAR